MTGPQLVTSPFRLLPPGHMGVTGPHEVSPGRDHILSALSPGEDQEMARPTAHVTHQLLKCLLGTGRGHSDPGKEPLGPAGGAVGSHATHQHAHGHSATALPLPGLPSQLGRVPGRGADNDRPHLKNPKR